ncbi:MAG: transcription termination factor Rho [Thermodesulfobacteriota bacterium]
MEEEAKKEDRQEKTLEEKLKEGRELDRMTAPDLREIAIKIEGVTGVHAMKKEELLRIIKQDRGIPDEEQVKRAEKEKAGGLTVKQLKSKVRLLRAEKATAREAKDPKRVDILRRRINRLKKRTKKPVKA